MKIEGADYYIVGRIKVEGTFIDVAYFMFKTSSGRVVKVEQRANGATTPVLVHGPAGAAPLAKDERLVIDDVAVKWATHGVRPSDTVVLVVQTSEWLISTTSRRIVDLKNVLKDRSEAPSPKTAAGKDKRQIDVSIQALVNPLLADANGVTVSPHGILGQAYDGDSFAVDGAQDNYGALTTPMEEYPYRKIVTRAMAEGAIEGEAADYEVSGGFGTAFAFSRWNRTDAVPPRNVSKLTGRKWRIRDATNPAWQAAAEAEGSTPTARQPPSRIEQQSKHLDT